MLVVLRIRVINSVVVNVPKKDFSPVCEFLVSVHTAKTGLLRCCLFMTCTCTNVLCEWVFCLHSPSVVGKCISRPTETGPNSEKKNTNGQTVKNARNSNFFSSNCCVPRLWTRTMATKATGFPAPVHGNSSPFDDRLRSRILQVLRTLVLFFVLLAGFEEWFYISAGSLPYIRRVISCILFSLEQSRVVDFTVEHHPGSILESNVLSFEFSSCCDV